MFEELIDPPFIVEWAAFWVLCAAAAGGAAALAVPAVQRGLYPSSREETYRDQIKFDRILADGQTIRCVDGSLFVTILVAGVDLSAKTTGDQDMLHQARKTWLNRLAEFGVRVRAISSRRIVPLASAALVPVGANVWLRRLVALWWKPFARAFRNQHALVLSISAGTPQAESKLKDAVENTMESLKEYRPEILRAGRPGEGSALLTFWGTIANPVFDRESVAGLPPPPPPGAPALSYRLPDLFVACQMDVFDGSVEGREDGVVCFRDGPRRMFMAGLGVSTWGGMTTSDVLLGVMSVDSEIIVLQNFTVMDAASGGFFLEEMARRSTFEKFRGGARAQYERAIAVNSMRSGEGSRLTSIEANVFIFAPTREALETKISAVRAEFARWNMEVPRLTQEIEPLWLSIFPPHMPVWTKKGEPCRGSYLLTANVAGCVSLERPSTGLWKCDWGPRPVTVFKTVTGSPYGFTWHIGPEASSAGHTMVIGGTGAGKSTLVNFLASQCLGYDDLHVFVLDSDDGAYVSTKAYGGSFLQVQMDAAGGGCALNPLQMDIDGERKGFLISWIKSISGADDTDSERAIMEQLGALAALPRADRTLRELYQTLPPNLAVRKGLERWVDGGAYGHLFNAARDTWGADGNRFVTLDMTHTLDDPLRVRALMPYIWFRIREQQRRLSRPFLIFFDELARLLKDEGMKKEFERLAQEARKNRGVLVAATQRPSSLMAAGQGILTLFPTKIVFPNTDASRDEYMDFFGLSDVEFAMISGRDPRASALKRWVLIKRDGEGSVIVDVDLSPLGDDLGLFMAGSPAANAYRRAERDYGPERAAQEYLRMLKLGLAA